MIREEIGICVECGSEFLKSKSKMASLCTECAHVLYGYEKCDHIFEKGQCIKCLWNGQQSEYVKSLKN